MLGIFHSIFRPFFSSFFIAISIGAKKCHLKLIQVKGGRVAAKHAREFNTIDGSLPIEAAKYIRELKRKHPFVYLATMARTYAQGAGDALPNYASVNIAKGWAVNIKKSAIDETRVKYLKALGLDYLFSPFVAIYTNIKNDLTDATCVYVLQEQSALSMVIASRARLRYAGYFSMGGDLESVETAVKHYKDDDELDLSIAEAIGSIADELAEIGELEDLDKEILKKEFLPTYALSDVDEQEENKRLEEVRDFARSGSSAEIISSAIAEFYASSDSDFIEKIVILDTYGMTKQAIFHLENNLMLPISIKNISLGDTLLELAQMEAK